jgi:histidine triad (HIT) family protein
MCLFCDIVGGDVPATLVREDEDTVAFLDIRPIFPGHTLLVPRSHHETLTDLPESAVEPFFLAGRTLAGAVQEAMDAAGTFVAMNNKVSQSVPHLHMHIVPRRPKDGLRGFFWPRQKYEGPEAMEQAAERIRRAVARRESSA